MPSVVFGVLVQLCQGNPVLVPFGLPTLLRPPEGETLRLMPGRRNFAESRGEGMHRRREGAVGRRRGRVKRSYDEGVGNGRAHPIHRHQVLRLHDRQVERAFEHEANFGKRMLRSPTVAYVELAADATLVLSPHLEGRHNLLVDGVGGIRVDAQRHLDLAEKNIIVSRHQVRAVVDLQQQPLAVGERVDPSQRLPDHIVFPLQLLALELLLFIILVPHHLKVVADDADRQREDAETPHHGEERGDLAPHGCRVDVAVADCRSRHERPPKTMGDGHERARCRNLDVP
mmetsp:Transcript_46025/g.127828  ORF Transcript_46025/g.127828 Transcript_46025/m.127828 type:complete len:286 (+) Transcript_46025:589-1446(+)